MKYLVITLLALCACSTRSIIITPDGINATASSFLYCPDASVTRIDDGNRTVDMIGSESGVGETLTGIVGGLP